MANLQSAVEVIDSLLEENTTLRRSLGVLFSQVKKDLGKARQRLQSVLEQEKGKKPSSGFPPWRVSPQEEENERANERLVASVSSYIDGLDSIPEPEDPSTVPETDLMYSFIVGFFSEVGGNVERILKNTHTLIKSMSALSDRLAQVLDYLTTKEAAILAELAAKSEALAWALADDAADDEAVAAAQAHAAQARAAAEAAQAKANELQALVDADVAEDEAIKALLDTVPVPAPEPAPEA